MSFVKNYCIGVLLLIFLTGCSGLGVLTDDRAQVAGRSFDHSFRHVKQAALSALSEMNIMIIESRSTATGQNILAATFDLDLTIELQTLDSGHTQVNVFSRAGQGDTGRKTAEQILDHTERFMHVALKEEGAV